ncbi:MAG: polar amino acid transporter, inner rane subunit [Clostridia bacterium]|jgi:putative lysine transport system permease protein|nr:polar amino acid transporter, inner rane subunit [Clostridia bacterium]
MFLLTAAAERGFFDWIFLIVENYWPLFIRGAGVTLLISITGTIIGSFIGLIVGVIRTIPRSPRDNKFKKIILKVIDFIFTAYIEIFRGTPMIVQAMIIFYGLNFQLEMAIPAGIFIVSINTGAYMSEIVRGGIVSVDKGQFEAAHSIGMNHWKTMMNIILPQVIRNILPATGNEFVINIKDTSVLNVISVNELYYQSKSIGGTYFKYFEVFLITCIIYFIMTFAVTRLLRLFEKKLEGPSTYTIHGSQTAPESEIKVRGE